MAEAIIAFIIIGLPVILIWATVSRVYRHKEKKMELEARYRATGHAETAKLEERIRILERIATDRGHLLAEEIDRLKLSDERSRPDA